LKLPSATCRRQGCRRPSSRSRATESRPEVSALAPRDRLSANNPMFRASPLRPSAPVYCGNEPAPRPSAVTQGAASIGTVRPSPIHNGSGFIDRSWFLALVHPGKFQAPQKATLAFGRGHRQGLFDKFYRYVGLNLPQPVQCVSGLGCPA
jgi:hypothetical protein